MSNEEDKEVPRQKRKYTKKSKMLLRSNNDYIDHEYWPKVYAESKEKWERIMAKHGVKGVPAAPTPLSDHDKSVLKSQGIGKHHIVPTISSEPVVRISIEGEQE